MADMLLPQGPACGHSGPSVENGDAAAAAPRQVKQRKAPRLEALDAPRWIASIQIVFSHFYTNQAAGRDSFFSLPPNGGWWNEFAYFGKNWTQFFFILSGFVLAYAEFVRPHSQLTARPSLLRYLRRRLITIYPTFVFSILVYFLQAPKMGPISTFQWESLIPTLLLMQSWVVVCGKTPFEATSMSWNVPAWFLSALVVYWVILRPAADFYAKRGLRFTCASLLFLWACSLVPGWLEKQAGPGGGCLMYNLSVGCLGYFHVFIAGVATARLFMLTCVKDVQTEQAPTAATEHFALAPERAPFVFRQGCCTGYLLYIIYFLFVDMTRMFTTFHNGGILPILVLIVLGGALGVDPMAKHVFKTRLFLTLGQLSYAQYLLQFPAYFFLVSVCGHPSQMWIMGTLPVALKIAFPFILIAAAYLSQRYVQRPYTEWQQWRQEKGIVGSDEKVIASIEGCCRRLRGGRGQDGASACEAGASA